MNLTKIANQICKRLNKDGEFNGIDLFRAETQSEDSKRKDAALDDLSEEETRAYVEDYACIWLEFDRCPESFSVDNAYTTIEFNTYAFANDLEDWIAKEFFNGDLSLFPEEFNPFGCDNEFMKIGYGKDQ